MNPIYPVTIPEYRSSSQLDYDDCGKTIDNVIKENFYGRRIVVRYLSTQDHPEKSADDLIKFIEKTGTDKYDPIRKMSVSHDFYIGKGVKLFGIAADINENFSISAEAIRDFVEGAPADRGYSLRPDVIVIYDRDQLDLIPIQYDDGVGEDAWRFKNADDKPSAVLGFIKII